MSTSPRAPRASGPQQAPGRLETPAAAPAVDPVIVTPEAVGLDLEIATIGSRGVAYLVDLLVLAVGFVLLSVAQATLGSGGFVPGSLGIAAALVLLFAWQFGYPIGFETLMGGRTPGKAAMGLRVITVEGAPVGVRHATIRATTAVLELLGSGGTVAMISSFASSRGQRLGDLAAGTLVVRERRSVRHLDAMVFAVPPGCEDYTARLDVHALDRADYATLRDTLRRAGELSADARESVMARLASRLVQRVRPEPPPQMGAHLWLRCVAAAMQATSNAASHRHPSADAPPPATRPNPRTAIGGGADTEGNGFAPPG